MLHECRTRLCWPSQAVVVVVVVVAVVVVVVVVVADEGEGQNWRRNQRILKDNWIQKRRRKQQLRSVWLVCA